ncbi:hypothetical protein AYK26_04975 [Euryarchaeota archaeon SM23-78]|nr:MAG: hypothetical protein AYK26_04975 [Euryarchaeota archaeon SM23-78]MBW3000922.1 transglycosylase SLT domain-containing protein [Candidatus Woesearchaeota archaeon]
MRRRDFLKTIGLGTTGGVLNLYLPKDIFTQEHFQLPPTPSLQGTFQNMELPIELAPQKNFWKRIYTEFEYSDAVFYNPETFQVEDVLKVNKRDKNITPKQTRALQEKKIELKKKNGEVRFERGQADDFKIGFERAAPYWNHCRRAFANNGVSDDRIYIGFLESCFYTDAVSIKYAVGAFQFLRTTGEKFLMIDKSKYGHAVDERLDPIKEAEATALLLRALYARYGNEFLAMNAFHSGKGNLDRALIFANHYSKPSNASKTFADIVQIFPKLTHLIRPDKKKRRQSIRGTYQFKSSQYVPGFFGVKEGVQEHFNFNLLKKELGFDSIVLKYSTDVRIRIIPTTKDKLELSLEDIVQLNQGLLYPKKVYLGKRAYWFFRQFMIKDHINKITPRMPPDYELRLPPGKGKEFLEIFAQYLDKEVFVKEHRIGESIQLTKEQRKGDILYESIVKLRRNNRREEVTLDMLEDVKNAYEQELKYNPNDRWLINSLKVINYDISEFKTEKKQKYHEKLEQYEEEIVKFVDKVREDPTILDNPTLYNRMTR